MPDETPPTPELSADEESKFDTWFNKMLARETERTPNPTAPPSPPPSAPPTQPTGDVGAQIRAALTDHDKEKGQHDTIGNLVKDVEALKQRNKPRHWWFRPFSPMSSD